MTAAPKVDVVILTWNDGALLGDAVSSAVDQTGVDATVIVVDNGSDPPATVDDPRVRTIRCRENVGVGGGRNVGTAVGSAEFVCFLDSDARLLPGTLAALVAPLVDDPTIALSAPVFTGQRPVESAGRAPTLRRKIARGAQPDRRVRGGARTGCRRSVGRGLRDRRLPALPEGRVRRSRWSRRLRRLRAGGRRLLPAAPARGLAGGAGRGRAVRSPAAAGIPRAHDDTRAPAQYGGAAPPLASPQPPAPVGIVTADLDVVIVAFGSRDCIAACVATRAASPRCRRGGSRRPR